MKIHANVLTLADVHSAASIAGATLVDTKRCGSRSRDHAFDVHLEGSSHRRPNRTSDDGTGTGYAATWDQWGVFLCELFYRDDSVTIPRVYRDVGEFDYKTDWRFETAVVTRNGKVTSGAVMPDNAHGDHTFRFAGMPYHQECIHCGAVVRWDSP